MNSYRETRYSELGYQQHDRGLWRIIATEDGAAIGPHYRTRSELLADLDGYAESYGCSPQSINVGEAP